MNAKEEDGQIRVSFLIDKSLHDRLKVIIPWGLQAALTRILLEKLADAGETHGKAIFGAVLDGKFKITGD
jgi:hypothetical protein